MGTNVVRRRGREISKPSRDANVINISYPAFKLVQKSHKGNKICRFIMMMVPEIIRRRYLDFCEESKMNRANCLSAPNRTDYSKFIPGFLFAESNRLLVQNV